MPLLQLVRPITLAWLLCGAGAAGAVSLWPTARAPRAGVSRVIIETRPGADIGPLLARADGRVQRRLRALDTWIADVPAGALAALEAAPAVVRVRPDRPVSATMARTSATIGATWVRAHLGYDGTGVGVAIVDSGVASWHDDLTGTPHPVPSAGGAQRVSRFVDFVNGSTSAYDDFGHGTHVAGVIAGNGYDSSGARAGVAPGASLVVLKVLDASGGGRVSDVISAIDYAIAQPRGARHPRPQPLGRRRRARVVPHRPAHARRPARRRGRPRGRHGGRQPRRRRRRRPAVRGRHGAGQRAVGHHRRRVQPPGHARPRGRPGRPVQLARSRPPSTTRPSRTWWPRASGSSR